MIALQFQSISSPISIDGYSNAKYLPNYNFCIKPVNFNPQVDIIKRISELKDLTNNWDGYNAISPDVKVILNSIKFIKSLPDSLTTELNAADIIPTPYGTVVFDWKNGSDEISVEIGETNIGFFSDVNGDSSLFVPSVKFNENVFPVELIQAFKKFLQPINA